MGNVSAGSVVILILTAISVLAAGYIILDFENITARIAVCVAGILTSGFPILMGLILIGWIIMRFRWGMRRRFWFL